MFYAQNCAFEIVISRARRYICTFITGMSSRTLYVQHPASLRIFQIFPSLPGSRLRLFIAMQIQYSDEHTFVQQYALCAEPCVGNCSSAKLERLPTCTTGMFSRTIYAQDPVSLRDVPISPQSSFMIFHRDGSLELYSAPFFIHPSPN